MKLMWINISITGGLAPMVQHSLNAGSVQCNDMHVLQILQLYGLQIQSWCFTLQEITTVSAAKIEARLTDVCIICLQLRIQLASNTHLGCSRLKGQAICHTCYTAIWGTAKTLKCHAWKLKADLWTALDLTSESCMVSLSMSECVYVVDD